MFNLKWNGSLEAQRQHFEARAKQQQVRKPRKKKHKKRKNRRPEEQHKVTQATGFVHYSEYLASSWWRRKRLQKLQSVGSKCERCGKRENLEVHHRHYRTLWREKNTDLRVLCRACHGREHECLEQCNSHLASIQRQEP